MENRDIVILGVIIIVSAIFLFGVFDKSGKISVVTFPDANDCWQPTYAPFRSYEACADESLHDSGECYECCQNMYSNVYLVDECWGNCIDSDWAHRDEYCSQFPRDT